jgi:hypothetical protein
MKYRIKLRKGFFGRETTLGWQLGRAEAIDEAKRRLDWKAATRARVVDETGRDVWRSTLGRRRQYLWLAGPVAALVVGFVVVSLLDGA